MLYANVIIFVSEYLSRIMIWRQQSRGYLKAHTELLYIFLFQDYQLPTSVFCDANVFILVKILVIFYPIVQNWTKSIKRSEIGSLVTFPNKTWKHCEPMFWFAEAPGMVFLTNNGTKSSRNNHINWFFGAVHLLVEVKLKILFFHQIVSRRPDLSVSYSWKFTRYFYVSTVNLILLDKEGDMFK